MHLALIVLKQFAENPRGGDELRRGEFLAADHQDMMIGEGTVQGGAGFGVHPLVQIKSANLRTGVLGQWRDRVSHRLVSSARLDGRSMATRPGVLQCSAGRHRRGDLLRGRLDGSGNRTSVRGRLSGLGSILLVSGRRYPIARAGLGPGKA